MGRVVVRAGTIVGIAGLLVAALVGPAQAAKHTKPGPVSGLVLSFTHPSDHYLVTAQWSAYPNATKYVVKMTDASGISIPSATTTGTTWSRASYAAAGTVVTVTVTVYLGKVRGSSAQVSALLPDVTPPVGNYSITRDPSNPTDGNVTVHAVSLSDDVTAVADLSQTVDWGDGTPVESWSPLDSQIVHVYPGDKAVYHPVVTLTDQAGNASTYQLVVAVADTQAPTGTFTAGPATGYTGWTTITVAQSALADDLSAPADIARVVNWGDGSAPEAWASGDTRDHVYAAAGTYTPTVTVTDEAGNSAVIGTSPVTLTADETAPTLAISTPKRHQSVRAWRYVRGTDVDHGVGVQDVELRIIEKRQGDWYYYTFKGHTWKKVGGSKQRTLSKATVKVLSIDDLERWGAKARGLRKGLLLVRAVSSDNVGNAAVSTVTSKLTSR